MKVREIKFRGRDVITGNWAYGYYYPSKGNSIIRIDDSECIVLKNSIGQFTGLKDKNRKEIYEGDIMHGNTSKLGAITFENGSFMWLGEPLAWDMDEPELCLPERWGQIIGNIYEHSDLLK